MISHIKFIHVWYYGSIIFSKHFIIVQLVYHISTLCHITHISGLSHHSSLSHYISMTYHITTIVTLHISLVINGLSYYSSLSYYTLIIYHITEVCHITYISIVYHIIAVCHITYINSLEHHCSLSHYLLLTRMSHLMLSHYAWSHHCDLIKDIRSMVQSCIYFVNMLILSSSTYGKDWFVIYNLKKKKIQLPLQIIFQLCESMDVYCVT